MEDGEEEEEAEDQRGGNLNESTVHKKRQSLDCKEKKVMYRMRERGLRMVSTVSFLSAGEKGREGGREEGVEPKPLHGERERWVERHRGRERERERG